MNNNVIYPPIHPKLYTPIKANNNNSSTSLILLKTKPIKINKHRITIELSLKKLDDLIQHYIKIIPPDKPITKSSIHTLPSPLMKHFSLPSPKIKINNQISYLF